MQEAVMKSANLQSRTSDAIAGMIVATLGTLMLLSRMDILSFRVNLPGAQEWMTWWPLLLIACGIVMLLVEREEHPLIGAVVQSGVPARPLVRNQERSHGF
jgi:Domain of unknown function (DUF5668)